MSFRGIDVLGLNAMTIESPVLQEQFLSSIYTTGCNQFSPQLIFFKLLTFASRCSSGAEVSASCL